MQKNNFDVTMGYYEGPELGDWNLYIKNYVK